MTRPPLVLSLFFIALVGWPLLKLVATLASRRLWRDQRTVRAALLDDPSLDETEKQLVSDVCREGYGSALQLALPVVAFFGGLAAAMTYPHGMSEEAMLKAEDRLLLEQNPQATERTRLFIRDERYRSMADRAFLLAALSYPVSSILTIVAIAPAVLMIAAMSGFHASQRKLAAAIVAGSRNAVLAFEGAFEGSMSRAR